METPVAVKLTQQDIESAVLTEQYHVFPGTTVTVCCLTLRNGFNATGTSACAHPDNFDAEIGRRLAREDALRKVWTLEGYLLKQEMFAARGGA
jgi:hypothetical protein